MDVHTNVFLSWNVLSQFLEIVRDKSHRDIMRCEDIGYWQMVFLSCPAIIMNAYDVFGCKLSRDNVPRGVSLDEHTQTLTFKNESTTGNPILWRLSDMFSYILGNENQKSVLLHRALLHISDVITFQDDLDSCMNALATCKPFNSARVQN